MWWWGSGDNLTSQRVLERHGQEGVEGGSPCGSSSKENLGIPSPVEGDTGRVSQQRQSYAEIGEAGGLGKKSGKSGSERGTGENGLLYRNSSSSASAAAFAATGEGEDRRDDVKASPLQVEEESLAMGEEPQRRWDRGLRRMVDGDSPSVGTPNTLIF